MESEPTTARLRYEASQAVWVGGGASDVGTQARGCYADLCREERQGGGIVGGADGVVESGV